MFNHEVGFLHRAVLEVPDGLERDHVNRNRLDNRRDNLRVVTRQENLLNRQQAAGWGVRCRSGSWRYDFRRGGVRYAKAGFPTLLHAMKGRTALLAELG
ncbi:unnamed protein product [marine sediment metagenome]|uniref:HNH nuclease domain-containing protein n=1 Tax=marine sediment metagenome TaxID=412755 RepID=X0XMK4_9ZZZZ